MAVVRIDSEKIVDWTSFHSVCKEAFGFPPFYGMNLDALIDCLSYIDEGDEMSNIFLTAGESLRIELLSADNFRTRLPEISSGLVGAIEAVNQRFVEHDKPEKIELVKL
jgi:RNAse (barnase) inhibitor barstar